MNLRKIKEKYPYKETKAVVIKILKESTKSGLVPDYDRVDELMQRDEQDGFRHRSFDEYEREVPRKLDFWYNYKLLIEFYDLNGQKHQGTIEMVSERALNAGSKVNVCYLIDNPNEIVEKIDHKTIEDYIEKRNLCLIVVGAILILTCLIIYNWIK